ncbi:hypothetical protein D9M68_926360 [compost metagenome]
MLLGRRNHPDGQRRRQKPLPLDFLPRFIQIRIVPRRDLGQLLPRLLPRLARNHHQPPRRDLAMIRHARADGQDLLQFRRIRPRLLQERDTDRAAGEQIVAQGGIGRHCKTPFRSLTTIHKPEQNPPPAPSGVFFPCGL